MLPPKDLGCPSAANGAPPASSDQKGAQSSCHQDAASQGEILSLHLLQYRRQGPTLHIQHSVEDPDSVLSRCLLGIEGLTMRKIDASELPAALSHDPDELVLVETRGELCSLLPALHKLAEVAKPTATLVTLEQLPKSRAKVSNQLRQAGVVTFFVTDKLDHDRCIAAFEHALDLQVLRKVLADTQSRFELALAGSRDGIWEWDISTGWVYFSPKCRELLGYPRDHPMQNLDDWLSRVHKSDRSSLRHELSSHVYKAGEQRHREHRVRLPDGSVRWLASQAVAQVDAQGRVYRISGSLADVSQYRAREQALRQQSRVDATTQLPRVEVFFEQLARQVELANEAPDPNQERFAIALLHIHGAANLHESHGPDAAARCLREVTGRLVPRIQDYKLCRFATHTLAMLVSHASPKDEVMRLMEAFSKAMQAPFSVENSRVHLAISAGAVQNQGRSKVQDLIADASAAASYARQKGPGSLQFFESRMRQTLRSRMRIESELREALHDQYDQFELFFQPIVNLVDHSVRGFESLIRWTHPELGKMPPVDFIPLAESTGLILPLGRWILRQAAHQLQRWSQDHDLEKFSLNVNISGRQAADPMLVKEIERLLESTQIEPSALKIELTETVFLEDSAPFQRMAKSLRERGVKLYIDDFGTGYSSLSYLHRFPVDGIKIDKSFIDNLVHDETSQALVRTIIALADSLSLDIVAEGIEHAEQANLLQAMGCPHAQGYLFGRPVDVNGATQALLARSLDDEQIEFLDDDFYEAIPEAPRTRGKHSKVG